MLGKSLRSLAYDKEFDRLTSICKSKYTNKLSELRKWHEASKVTVVIALL